MTADSKRTVEAKLDTLIHIRNFININIDARVEELKEIRKAKRRMILGVCKKHGDKIVYASETERKCRSCGK